MKKALLLFLFVASQQIVNSQNDQAVKLHTVFNPWGESCFLSTLPTGENIVATAIDDAGNLTIINIKKIALDGSVSTHTNLICPYGLGIYPTIMGLSCSASGEYTCLLEGYNSHLYLVKFSVTGSILWQKDLAVPEAMEPYYGSVNSFVENNSGDYFLSISDWRFSGVIKIDPNGNILWSKKILGPTSEDLVLLGSSPKSPSFSISARPDGGCISTLKDESYQCLVSLNSDGSLAWSKSFIDGIYRWPKCVRFDNLGNLQIMGSINMSYTYIQKLDPLGNQIMAKIVQDSAMCRDMYITNTNETVLIEEGVGTKVTKLDNAFNHLWSRKISGIDMPATYTPLSVFSNVQTSTISFFSKISNSDYAIMKFSGDFNDLCNTYDSPAPVIYDDTTFTSSTVNTGLAVSALIVNENNATFFVSAGEFYTASEFCVANNITENSSSNAIYIYPNPASDNFTVNVSHNNSKQLNDATIIVYDITGKIILEKKFDGSPIQTSHFISGIYNVMIRNSDKVIGSERVIIQK